MTYQFEVIEAAPQPILSIRVKTTPEQIAASLGQLYGEIGAYLASQNMSMTGQPAARYHDYQPHEVDLEAVIQVGKLVEGTERIVSSTLPGGKLATTWHVGSYDTLRNAQVAFEQWMGSQTLQQAGAHWEVYVTDPGEEPDSSKWKTQIFWPLG